jgi:adenylosuccinate synthase
MLHYILGITKAYCTRVGGGPFPTELDWEVAGTPGYHMSTVGAEKGVTTGRSRRCGWFDAALLKRSAQVNGLTGLCITKLDVLDGLERAEAVHRLQARWPAGRHVADGRGRHCERCKPIYETMPGWSDSNGGCHPIRQAAPMHACICSALNKSPACRSTWCPPARSGPHDPDASPVSGRLAFLLIKLAVAPVLYA